MKVAADDKLRLSWGKLLQKGYANGLEQDHVSSKAASRSRNTAIPETIQLEKNREVPPKGRVSGDRVQCYYLRWN